VPIVAALEFLSPAILEEWVERRLAAILVETLAALKALRKSLIAPKIAEHRGRIVKTMGDGALVEFGSAVDALRCAID
jgi:class 3 adenylate cyclase